MLVTAEARIKRQLELYVRVAHRVARSVSPEAMPRWAEGEDVAQEVLCSLWMERRWVGLSVWRAHQHANKAVGRFLSRQADILDFEVPLLPEHELLEAA